MKRYSNFIILSFLIVSLCACSPAKETARVFWGSSIAHLERSRATGNVKTFQCSYSQCFDAVVALSIEQETEGEELKKSFYDDTNSADLNFDTKKKKTDEDDEVPGRVPKTAQFYVFQKSLEKGYIVVMHIPGAVDTTEVGIFFTPLDSDRVRVEIASLSTHAKITVSRIVYDELNAMFTEVKDDRT